MPDQPPQPCSLCQRTVPAHLITLHHLKPKQRGGKDLRPTVKLLNAKGKEATFANTEIPAVYTLPPGALIALEDGARVSVGECSGSTTSHACASSERARPNIDRWPFIDSR